MLLHCWVIACVNIARVCLTEWVLVVAQNPLFSCTCRVEKLCYNAMFKSDETESANDMWTRHSA
eukprot:m.1109451 g.1109451  ORF g.1109451 m.1109451 type:complete len:64 (+) comp24352_c0_seq61:1583-1774(+)